MYLCIIVIVASDSVRDAAKLVNPFCEYIIDRLVNAIRSPYRCAKVNANDEDMSSATGTCLSSLLFDLETLSLARSRHL